MADLDEILAAIQALANRIAVLEGGDPTGTTDPPGTGNTNINDINWVDVWEGIGEVYASSSVPGLASFATAIKTAALKVGDSVEQPLASVFRAIAEVAYSYSWADPQYMSDVPFGQFIGTVYNYLVAEKNEDGASGGVTLDELMEAVAYGIDNILRRGPLTNYKSKHRISGLRPGPSVSSVLSPLALLLRRLAVYGGEGTGMGEDGTTIIIPSDPPPGGWPWSMPGS